MHTISETAQIVTCLATLLCCCLCKKTGKKIKQKGLKQRYLKSTFACFVSILNAVVKIQERKLEELISETFPQNKQKKASVVSH